MSTVDLSEFEALSRGKGQKRLCAISVAFDRLDDAKQVEQLTTALAKPNLEIPAIAIIEWLKIRGIKIANPNLVTSHRRRTCTCYDG